MSTVVVFGGSGFLGRQLVDRLTADGMTVCVAVRHPDGVVQRFGEFARVEIGHIVMGSEG